MDEKTWEKVKTIEAKNKSASYPHPEVSFLCRIVREELEIISKLSQRITDMEAVTLDTPPSPRATATSSAPPAPPPPPPSSAPPAAPATSPRVAGSERKTSST